MCTTADTVSPPVCSTRFLVSQAVEVATAAGTSDALAAVSTELS
jgi:hypothetical protein